MIHLGYAFELSSREIAMEALGLTTTSYNFLHKYLDDPAYTKPSTKPPQTPLEILHNVASDSQFDGLLDHRGSDNIEKLLETHEASVLDYWNAWRVEDPTRQFEDSQRAAVALLAGTTAANSNEYDFFLVHLLTTSHAVRILLPFIPTKFHVPLVRQWWLFTLIVYVAQLRPAVNIQAIEGYDIHGKDWEWINKQAIDGKSALDAHFVKALRAMKEAAQTWGDEDSFYLKAAVKFASEFSGWGGFDY